MKKNLLLFTCMLIAYNYNLIAQERIIFTWQGDNNKNFGMQTDEDESFTIDWGDGTVPETKTGNSRSLGEYSHNYQNNEVYTVTITSNNAVSFICLSFNGQNYNRPNIITLNVDECPYLKELDCNFTHLTTLNINNNGALTKLYCNNSYLTSLNISGAPALAHLICNGNKIKILDLSNNFTLQELNANKNNLTSLNISNTQLSKINIMDNQFLLSNLWSICVKIKDISNRRLGKQQRPVQHIGIGRTVDFSGETAFGGINTVFTVTQDDMPVTQGTYYTVNNGKFTFLQDGIYDIKMTNPAITGIVEPPSSIATFHVAPAGTDVPLSTLEVLEGELTPEFNPDVLSYIVNVEQGIDSITIIATVDVNATIEGTGKFPLQAVANEFTVTVIAEDGVTKLDYIITVIRAGFGTDATLSSLTVSPGALTPAFFPTTFDYTVSVENETDSITIAATPADANAIVAGTGKFPLTVGNNNVFTVTVTAGTATLNYGITVTRAGSGIPFYEKTMLEVYPNPTTGELKIKNYELKDANIVIFDVTGRMQSHSVIRHETGEAVINISHLPAGVYFMQIENQTLRVVKE